MYGILLQVSSESPVDALPEGVPCMGMGDEAPISCWWEKSIGVHGSGAASTLGLFSARDL